MRSLVISLPLVALLSSPAHALLGSIGAGTPPGWPIPVVPRNTGDAPESFAPIPAQLLSTQPTFFNWAIHQNAAIGGTWQDELYLDGDLLQLVTRSNDVFAERYWIELNTGPTFVAGGRHTVEIWADRLWQTGEDRMYRYDNDWTVQFLWQPRLLAPNSVGYTKPPVGEGNAPNVNAFSFTRAPGTAWVVSGGAAGMTTPVVVYDDYVNSTTGLTHVLSQSSRTGGLTNYVVGTSAAAATLYPGIFRTPESPSGYAPLSVCDASGRMSGSGFGSWPSVNQPAGMLAQVFGMQCTAGEGEVITLTRIMGVSDLEVRVFPPGLTAVGPDATPWVSTPRGGDDEYDDLVFTPAETGTYLIVVSRVDASHAGEACGYTLQLALAGTVDVPAGFAPASLAAAPSPSSGPTRLSFALAQPAHVSLALYDVQGRAVRRLVDEMLPAGPVARTWDGTNDEGRAMAPGRYFARLIAGSRRENVSIVRVR